MSHDIIKSLNKINISVNENDQVLWECQASSKAYNETIIKLREECDRLNKDIAKFDEEINEIQPQIKVLTLSYDVQIESLLLNQQSLINQRLYKKCLKERINEYQNKEGKIIEEYTQYIHSHKKKLEISNPTYKLLQTKRTELKQSKVYCLDLKYKIIEQRNINNQQMKIKQRLFYNDIIHFVQNWLNKRKFLEIMSHLKEETKRERELIQKLTEATEKLKQTQIMNRYLRNLTSNYNIPQIEFPEHVADNMAIKQCEKAKTQMNNSIDDIKTMLENTDPYLNKSDRQRLKFSNDNSKVRILQNTTLKPPQEVKTPSIFKSKEERSEEIAAKIEKVVQNFNKNISRQNSKRSVVSSQTSQSDKKLDTSNVQLIEDGNREYKNADVDQNSQKNTYQGSGATQAIQCLKLTSEEAKKTEFNFFNQESDRRSFQFSNKQLSYFNNDKADSAQKYNKKDHGNKFPQNTNFPSQGLPNINKTAGSTENATDNANQTFQLGKNLDNKTQTDIPGGKSAFIMSASGFSTAFGGIGDNNNATFLRPADLSARNNNLSFDHNISLETPGFFMDVNDDYEATFKSPEFTNYNTLPTEENSAGVGNLFTFGQSGNLFTFK